jgi:hypothetical protein
MSEASPDGGMRRRLLASMAGGLLFVYVASTGPVIAYVDTHHQSIDDEVFKQLRRFYYPLVALSDACTPVQNAFQWYIEWCEKVLFRRDAGVSRGD